MVLYFAAMLTIGFVYSKRSNSSTKQYFAGGRGVGPWLTALSAEASDMSGWLLMGLPGVAYFTGAADPMWTAIGLALGTYLNWKLVARRLRRYSVVAGDAITIPDFFSKRFHDDRNIVSTIAALIILVFFCVYVGSCFVTVGKLFSTLFGWDYHLTMVIGAAIVFAYTIIGGYLSVVVTDFIQGLLMFFALAVVFIGSVASAGGIDNTVAFLKGIPGFLDGTHVATPILNDAGEQIVKAGQAMFGAPADYGIITIISMLAWGLGYFGMPQVLVRFLSIRSSEEIKKSRIIATTWCVISLACGVCIGLVGRAMMPTQFATQAAAENIFIVVSQALLPSFMCGIVVSGIFAASMSSSSSYMIIGASAVGENIFRGLLHRKATDRQVMMVARITLLVMFIFGIVVAFDQNSFDLPSGLVRVGRPRRILRTADAHLAVLEAHQQVRRDRGHAVRHGHRAHLAQPRQAARWHLRHLRSLLPAFYRLAAVHRGDLAAHACAKRGSAARIRPLSRRSGRPSRGRRPCGRRNRRRGEALADLNRPAVGVAPPATPKVGLWCRVACLWQIPTTGKCQVACLWHLIQETPCMSIGIPTDIHGVSRFPCHK